MDTVTAVWMLKGAVVLAGLIAVLRLFVKEYEATAEAMAGPIARAALERERRRQTNTPGPRVTLSPAGDAANAPRT
jgi:hypothetical protein